MDIKTRRRLAHLHAMLGSSHAGEAENARAMILEILHEHGRSWNDVLDLLHTEGAADARSSAAHDGRRGDQSPVEPSGPPPLDPLIATLSDYLQLAEHEYVAVALWIAHSFVYQQFMCSPRLALTSPVRRCGKTNALSLLAVLCHHGERFDGLTPAAIYRLVHAGELTLLCDEVDTYRLHKHDLLRSVFNSGHRRGGRFGRASRDGVARYSSYAPMALAAIGARSLPLTVLDRSILVRMTRRTRHIKRFDDLDPGSAAHFEAIHTTLGRWSRGVALNRDPEIPAQLHDRAQDNWRPLLAIADSAGSGWGARAREAAIAMSRGLQHEDRGVILLDDIRGVFDARDVDRIFSQVLVDTLVALEGRPWSEWRGMQHNHQPRPLTQTGLAQMLEPFEIAPGSIWPVPRMPDSKSRKGYYRHQFEDAWRAYCGPEDGRAEPRVRILRSA